MTFDPPTTEEIVVGETKDAIAYLKLFRYKSEKIRCMQRGGWCDAGGAAYLYSRILSILKEGTLRIKR
jgi:hypothetical protein